MAAYKEQLQRIVGAAYVKDAKETLAEYQENTLGVRNTVPLVILPKNTQEVQKIVKFAQSKKLSLYPISKGWNVGYGTKTPWKPNCIVVDLQRMNTIREYDEVGGTVIVEPGVTQTQLYEFLQKHSSPFWCDATGSGLQASIVGNALEGGFGHTPSGNHRKTISDVEVVLGNGTVMQTGTFPGLGPDLAGIFVQSNFGIITALRIELTPIPEKFVSFMIQMEDDHALQHGISVLRELRKQGTLPSLVHIANATRSIVTTMRQPQGFDGVVTDEVAANILSTPLIKIKQWTAIGGLYGSKSEVRARIHMIRRAVHPWGTVKFFSDAQCTIIHTLLQQPLMNMVPGIDVVRSGFASYQELRGLMKGKPTDVPMQNIGWRVDKDEDIGIIWFAPIIRADPQAAELAIDLGRKVCYKYGFEYPLTMTFVEPTTLIGIQSIHFDKTNKEQMTRAHQAYHELNKVYAAHGIYPYRAGLLAAKDIKYPNGRREALRQLKKAYDPQGIIAPDKYGL
jgi:4-cresol dehydrogenase (hydroxylating)